MKIVLSKILNNFRETYVLTVYFGRKDILRMTNYCQERYIDEVSKKIKNKCCAYSFMVGINPFHATVSFYTPSF